MIVFAFVIDIWDIGIWIAVSSAILLITTELLAPYNSMMRIMLDIKKLRVIAIAIAILSMTIAIIRAYIVVG